MEARANPLDGFLRHRLIGEVDDGQHAQNYGPRRTEFLSRISRAAIFGNINVPTKLEKMIAVILQDLPQS